MTFEINAAAEPRGFAVLLHPHPDYGGNRFHPFIDGLFHRLPAAAISAVRFDFSSGVTAEARYEAANAIDSGAARWPDVPAILAGYSFGAGIATSITDPRVVGWYLLAPQVEELTAAAATIGKDPRPKAIAVPEHDQFSPPERVRPAVAGWEGTTVTTVPGADHYLGAVEPIVGDAVNWIRSVITR